MREHGLRLREDGGLRQAPIHAVDDIAALGEQDLVILAVKGPALAQVAPAVAGMLGPKTVVVPAMNGVPWWFFDGLPGACQGLQLDSVDPGGSARAHIPSAQVVGAVALLRTTQSLGLYP